MDRDLIRCALATSREGDAVEEVRSAAVSVILLQTRGAVELLLIRRAERPSDPWSGHMALPGGHRDPTDASLLDTAIRETLEEIGVDLTREAELLGRLDDLSPVRPRALRVRPFVFALERLPQVLPSAEVDAVVWAHAGELAAGRSASAHELVHEGRPMRFPAFRVGERDVWGLTYRVLEDLFGRVAACVDERGVVRAPSG